MNSILRAVMIAAFGIGFGVMCGCQSGGEPSHAPGYTDAHPAGEPQADAHHADPVPNVPAGGMTVTPEKMPSAGGSTTQGG